MLRRLVKRTYSRTCRRSVRCTTGASRSRSSWARSLGDAALLGVDAVAAAGRRAPGRGSARRGSDSSPNSSISSFWSGVAVSSSFGRSSQRVAERPADLVARPVGVAEPVRLVDDHQVPRELADQLRARPAAKGWLEMTGTGWSNGLWPARTVRPSTTSDVEVELLEQLRLPLRPQRRRGEDEDAALPLGHELGRGRCPPRWSSPGPPRRRACSRRGEATRARTPPPPPGVDSGRPGPRRAPGRAGRWPGLPLRASSSASNR